MGTELVKQNRGIAEQFADGENPYLKNSEGNSEFFGQFLKFSGTTGVITYGEDDDEIDAGHEFIVNFPSAQRGWICWVDSEVVDEINITISSGERFPKESELEDHGPYETHKDGTNDGWSEQYTLHMYSEELEQAFTFKTTSKSGIRAVRELLKTYGAKVRTMIGEDGEYKVTSISFGVYDFKPKNVKKVKKLYAPKLKILEWIEVSEIMELFQEEDGDDPDNYDDGEDEDEAPPTSSRRNNSSDDEDDDTPPKSRRKRKSSDDDDEAPQKKSRGRKSSDDDDDDEDKAPPKGRRTATRHAPPQDDDDDEGETSSRRSSARGRRGRGK